MKNKTEAERRDDLLRGSLGFQTIEDARDYYTWKTAPEHVSTPSTRALGRDCMTLLAEVERLDAELASARKLAARCWHDAREETQPLDAEMLAIQYPWLEVEDEWQIPASG